uniref:Transposon Ty3-I Gag-Pol polyprotein n=1 Tax=Cajanus cajan TaxID=3821 RepID=A0A151T1M1_CAJCA|nr:Transposon Ty3-I Gag-Pol polyprotein [Cajanus cajan]
MCVDYTDLKRACPKDSYPLVVNGASRHALLSFLHAYSGYNQIMMYPPDKVHTSFITDHTKYCYRVMPFSLKNAGATCQQLMDKVFMEVYVDDMVVKTTSATDHNTDLAEVFAQISRHNMRLNPEKCVFGVQGGKFLSFMIISRGIEANPEKCKAIIQIFGIPHTLVTDNGRQFIAQGFEDFLHELGIKHLPTSVEHPQTNGQAEAANKVILRELKKRLGNAKGQWADELPSILWAYHCTPQSTTQETPYRLTFGRSFRVGNLVWRLLGEAWKDTSEGKFAPTWGGPFRVTEDLENGAYRLEELSGKPVPRTWNATHLKFYFS